MADSQELSIELESEQDISIGLDGEDNIDLHLDSDVITVTTDNIVHSDTTANWNAQRDLIAKRGHIYTYTDYKTINGVDIPGIKIGDGTSYLIDMPFVQGNSTAFDRHISDMSMHVTAEDRLFWNDKVTCFLSAGDAENLVFTKSQGGLTNG